MFMGWCFQSQLVLPCTNRHHIKPIFSCLCLQGGAFSRKLYFRVQTGTKTNLFLVVYVYGVALSRNFYFRVQPGTKTNLFSVVCFYGVVLLVAYCTSVYKQAPQQTYLTGDLVVFFFWDFQSQLVLPVQIGTKTNLFLFVYVY